MALAIHDYFQFYSASNLYAKYLEYINPQNVLSFQSGASTSEHYNGISYTQIQSNDGEIDANGIDTGINYEYSFVMWDSSKLISEHPLTLSDADKTRGNRIIGAPIMVERVGTTGVSNCIFQVAHNSATSARFISYNSGSRELVVRLSLTQPSLDILGKTISVASEISGSSSVTVDAGTLDLLSDIKEWDGIATDFDGTNITITLDSSPSNEGDLNSVKWLSFGKQNMYILPLGTVRSGTDSYKNKPEPDDQGWVYSDPAQYMIGPYRTVSPRIDLEFPSNGDKFKCLIVIERDSGLGQQENGFKLLPVAII